MDFKVIWSDEAITDLRSICLYIARNNQEAALKMGNGILDHVRILAQFPFIGPAYPRGARGFPASSVPGRPDAKLGYGDENAR
jgi:plasmid stabilization system protein ParE